MTSIRKLKSISYLCLVGAVLASFNLIIYVANNCEIESLVCIWVQAICSICAIWSRHSLDKLRESKKGRY